MGRSRRGISAGTAAALAVGAVLALGGPVGAVPTKSAQDPCAVLTDADLGGTSAGYAIDKTDPISAGSCLYYLSSDSDSTTIDLFVQTPKLYSSEKSFTTKVKKVSGVPGGYVGQIPGRTVEAALKSGNTSIRIGSDGLSAAEMAGVLKAINQHL